MRRFLFTLGLLALFGVGCYQPTPSSPNVPAAIPSHSVATPATDPFSGWQTYTDSVRGFRLRYPADTPTDITSASVYLPQATGEKERQLKIDVTRDSKTNLDGDGCIKWNVPAPTHVIHVGSVPVCVSILDEGAAGSTYRTYHYTTRLKNHLIADVAMTIRFATSVRVYAECEADADQVKQRCIDLSFDEARDTELFQRIIGTLQKF